MAKTAGGVRGSNSSNRKLYIETYRTNRESMSRQARSASTEQLVKTYNQYKDNPRVVLSFERAMRQRTYGGMYTREEAIIGAAQNKARLDVLQEELKRRRGR